MDSSGHRGSLILGCIHLLLANLLTLGPVQHPGATSAAVIPPLRAPPPAFQDLTSEWGTTAWCLGCCFPGHQSVISVSWSPSCRETQCLDLAWLGTHRCSLPLLEFSPSAPSVQCISVNEQSPLHTHCSRVTSSCVLSTGMLDRQ